MRPSHRQANELRKISFTRNYTKHAEGAVLAEFGDTKVICTASVEQGVPRFLRDANQGWLTAEYGMLPRATHTRSSRESARGKQGGRTVEIQRIIGRALRAAVNLKALKDYTIHIDCDVVQADGGTRTAAITGSCVALVDALRHMQMKHLIDVDPLNFLIGAISVGVYQGEVVLDLDYREDSRAETDMNVIMTENGDFIEIQGTAEKRPFTPDEFNNMLSLAREGIQQIITQQKIVLGFVSETIEE